MLRLYTRAFTGEADDNDNPTKEEIKADIEKKVERKIMKNSAILTSILGAGVAGVGYLGHRLEKSDPLYRRNPHIKTVKTAGKIGAGASLAAAGLAGYLHYKDKKDKQK